MTTLLVLTFLASCVPVERNITARHLAALDAAFGVLPPATVIAPAPEPGVERTVTRADLDRWAERHGLRHGTQRQASPQAKASTQAETEAAAMPSEVPPAHRACVVRVAQPPDREDIAKALRAAAPDWHIELLDWQRLALPRGHLRFDARSVPRPPRPPSTAGERGAGERGAGAVPPVLWRGVLLTDDAGPSSGPEPVERSQQSTPANRRYPVWVRARVWIERPAVRAAEDLAAGAVLDEARLELSVVAEHPLWPSPLGSVELASGQRARRTLRAGAVVLAQDVAPVPAVQRGDRLAVEAGAGPARLTMEATAEANAGLGQIVVLKNPANGRRFQARIIGPGRASAIAGPLVDNTRPSDTQGKNSRAENARVKTIAASSAATARVRPRTSPRSTPHP